MDNTTGCHPTHETEYRDSSHYEERCVNCEQTDTPGGWGKLAMPCPATIDTSWSKLVDTDMGKYVLSVMDAHKDLRYHTSHHVRSLYAHAQELEIQYDINLDAAILFHDVIYDSKPDKELRSAEFMRATAINIPEWFEGIHPGIVDNMIMNTVGHKITPGINQSMIMLDLYELTNMARAAKNFESILEESMLLYGITRKEAAQGSNDFMLSFRETIISNAAYAEETSVFWTGVLLGVDQTIKLARAVINR